MGKETLQIISLLQANEKERAIFSAKIRNAKGNLPVLVHPFYPPPEYDALPDVQRYQQKRTEVIDAHLTDGSPLTIFEEEKKVPLLNCKIGKKQGTVYIIETLSSSSIPRKHTWDNVASCLQNAGATEVTLGGAYLLLAPVDEMEKFTNYLWFGEKPLQLGKALKRLKQTAITLSRSHDVKAKAWLDQDLIPDLCVGTAAVELLEHGIDVSFSPASLRNPCDPPFALKK